MAIPTGSGMLSISIDTKKVENMLNGYIRKLPKAMDKMTKKIAGMYSAYYLAQMQPARIEEWTRASFGALRYQATNPVRLGIAEYGVIVPSYLIALDRMKPHWVSLKRGRTITKWAEEKLGIIPTWKARGGERRIQSKLFVKPHHWIRSANIKAGMQVRNIAEFDVNQFLKEKGL